MATVVNYLNETETISQNQINVILPLISIMAAQFIVNSFTLISDFDSKSLEKFQKITSNRFLGMNYQNSVLSNNKSINEHSGIIIWEKSEADISQLMTIKLKLVIAIYIMREDNFSPPEFLSKIVFPLSVPFFLVLLSEESKFNYSDYDSNEITAKCFRLYKPIPNVPLKKFLIMSFGGQEKPKWFWEPKKNDWNFFWKDIQNMTGVNITIGLATHSEKELSIKRFWVHKNSFFWRATKEHLNFRPVIHFHLLTSQSAKGAAAIYLSLLRQTVADGLAVLPVISSERDLHLEFILTGCDSKYHLMVKTPEYVHSWQSIFKPFALESWLCMGVCVLLISLALRTVTYVHNFHTFNLSNCCLTVFGFVCFQSSTNIPKSSSLRMVCYTALSFSIIMYQFYTSNFYSLLSTKEVKLPFTSLQQFMTKGTHKMYIHPETALYAQIMNAKSGILKKLWEEYLKKDPNHQLKTETRVQILKNVCKGKGAIFGLPFQTIYFRELECKLVPVNSGYFPTNVVSVFRKNFPFKSQFQFVHWRLLEAGLSHKFRNQFVNIEPQHKTESVTNEPVSLEHVAFPFLLLSTFIIFSFLILIIEIIVSKTVKIKK